MAGPKVTEHGHENSQAFAASLADRLATELTRGLQGRGTASFAVPGGTTPAPIFDNLAKRDLDWSKVTVTLTDERWVPVTDTDSNEMLVRSHLLRSKAAQAYLAGLYVPVATPSAATAEITHRLKAIPLPFDSVLLGMGNDGHFASLFPGMKNLMAGLSPDTAELCIPCDQPVNGQPRMSLTLQLLLQSRVILLAIRGAEKMQVIERAKTARPEDLPIAAILTQTKVPVEIHYTD